MALIDKLKAIADAIRGKTGSTEEMTLDEMAVAIGEISGGGSDDLLIGIIEKTATDVTLPEGRPQKILCNRQSMTVCILATKSRM